MENVDKEIIDDAMDLCERAIDSKDDGLMAKIGTRVITIDDVPTHIYVPHDYGYVLRYKQPQTRYLLKREKIMVNEEKYPKTNESPSFLGTQYHKKESVFGCYKVFIDYEKAQEWIDHMNTTMLNGIKQVSKVEFNGDILKIHLKDDIFPISFTTSRDTNNMKDVFELLYNIYNKQLGTPLSKDEIMIQIAKKRHIDVAELTEGFVKTTIGHIRARFKNDKNIKDVIKIIFKDGGYLLQVS